MPRPPTHVYFGRCRSHELCIDDPAPVYGWRIGRYPLATCVSTRAFKRLVQAFKPNPVRRVTIFPSTLYQRLDCMEELILTGQNDDAAIFQASGITLVARDAENNPLGEEVACTNCGRLAIYNVPAGTANFDANITLPHVNDTANLASFSRNRGDSISQDLEKPVH